MKQNYQMAAAACLLIAGAALWSWLVPGSSGKSQVPPALSAASNASAVITTYNSRRELETETFAKTPERVIALWQGPIETLLALGVGDRIVAATGIPDEKFLRPDLAELYEEIPYHAFESLDKESAVAWNPDFIVTSWESAFSDKGIGTTSFWQSRGVKTYIGEIPRDAPEKRTLDYEYKVIMDMGKIFHVEPRAEEIVQGMRDRMKELQTQAAAFNTRPTVMIVQYMGKQIMSWGDNYLQADIVKNLGGRLLFHETGFITEEEILRQRPDVIFLMVNEWDYDHKEEIRQKLLSDPSLNSLPCIQNGRVYLFPLYEGQYSGVRTAEGVERIAKGLYPDIQ